MKFAVAAGALALALFLSLPARSELIDGVVAAVDYEVVALSTLQAYRSSLAPDLSPDSALQALIDDRLLAREAERYGRAVSKERLAQAKTPRPEGLTQAEWEAMLGDHLLAQDFLDFRYGGLIPISRDELRAYYERHREQWPAGFEQSEEALRAQLAPAIRSQRQNAYKEELRVRSNVRIDAGLIPSE